MKLRDENKKSRKLPVPAIILLDLMLIAAGMSIFLLFYYVIPQNYNTQDTQVVAATTDTASTFALPTDTTTTDTLTSTANTTETDSTTTDSSMVDSSTDTTASVITTDTSDSATTSATTGTTNRTKGQNTGNTGTTQIAADTSAGSEIASEDIVTTLLNSYSSDNMQITINKNVMGTGSDTVTYYVADIYVTSVDYLLSAFANDTYGKNIKDTISGMATDNNAILAVNGDFYGDSEEGTVIRNGVVYRTDVVDADVCVLFTDGTMKTYSPEDFDADTVIAQGAWQAWTFGPALLDGSGNVLTTFNTTDYINGENPRTAIGYVSPGHYVLVVVDGRDEGYSRGVTVSELAAIMAEEGCQTAYNLDGGKSSAMVFEGEYINQPADGGREVSDIIYLAE